MRRVDSRRTLAAAALIAATALTAGAAADGRDRDGRDGAPVTHGVSAGDVTSDSAVIWSRTNVETTMHAVIEGGRQRGHRQYDSIGVRAADDYTGKIRFTGLQPDTWYEYKVWFGPAHAKFGAGGAEEGRFRTAPSAQDRQAVTFAWGGDVAGQNVCRDAAEGFPIFDAINASDLDFFIGLGDMIYADGVCNATGLYGNAQVPGAFNQAASMADYWAHWKYNREDAGYRALLARMPYYAIWDDHEVVNDFGPLHDTRSTPPYTAGVHLLPMGLEAMLDYNPILPARNTPKRLYRNVRWGKHLEMFILDNRQYRDANFEADDPGRPKTMLGREQVTWLKEGLDRSRATWKVIVSSVPMSIPTGSAGAAGRDGWANYQQAGGFELELIDILRHMQQNGHENVLWITTDVHFSEVFRYTPFTDAPDFVIHEVVTGPMNAGIFPNAAFDTTLGTESLFRYPVTTPATYAEAKQGFNYGLLAIDRDGGLTTSVNGVSGAALFELTLNPR